MIAVVVAVPDATTAGRVATIDAKSRRRVGA